MGGALFALVLVGGLALTWRGVAAMNLAGMTLWEEGEVARLLKYLAFLVLTAAPGIVAPRYLLPGLALFVAPALLLAGLPAIATLALIGLAAYALGAALLARLELSRRSLADDGMATVLGLAVIAVALAVVGGLRLHGAPVYALAVCAACIFGRRQLGELLRRSAAACSLWQPPAARSERTLLFALVGILQLHWIVGLKPDVGYDALAMHAAFPVQVALEHRWSYDVGRYVWAVMPLGADWLYTLAYLLAGDTAMRLSNVLAFFAVTAYLYQLLRREHSRWTALAVTALFASTPFLYLESTTNFIEHWQTLLQLAGFAAYLRWRDTRVGAWLYVAAALLGAALTFKVMSVFAALAVGVWFVLDCRRGRFPGWRTTARALAVAVALACPPYLGALWLTGNPVFPFFNNLFKSPFYDTLQAFTNPMYVRSLDWGALYALTFDTAKFLETDKPGGFGLFLLPLLPAGVALLRPRSSALVWASLCLTLFVFVAIYSSQAYVRYLYLPYTLAMLVIAGAIEAVRQPPAAGLANSRLWVGALTLAVLATVTLQLYLMPAASNLNGSLCFRCATAPEARQAYVDRYAAERSIAEMINKRYREPRVGMMALNRPLGGIIAGYVRSDSWHDVDSTRAFTVATDGDAIAAWARRLELSLFVFPGYEGPASMRDSVRQFRSRYTRTIFSAGDMDLATWKDAGPLLAEFSGSLTGWSGASARTPLQADGSVRVTANDQLRQVVPVVAGNHYRTTATGRCEGPANALRLQTTWLDAAGKLVGMSIRAKPCVASFQEFETGAVAPPHAASAVVHLSGHSEQAVYVGRLAFGPY